MTLDRVSMLIKCGRQARCCSGAQGSGVEAMTMLREIPRAYLIDQVGVIIAIVAVFLGAYALPEGDRPLSLTAAFLMLTGLWIYFRRALFGRPTRRHDNHTGISAHSRPSR